MTTTQRTADSTDVQAIEAAAGAVLDRVTAATEALTMQLGLELGLYAALDRSGSLTPPELAEAAAIHPRYAREWLEQQVTAGVLACDDPDAPEDERRFRLPPASHAVLLDPASGAYVGPLLGVARGTASVFDAVLDAFRSGGGVPYHAYGHHLRHGLGEVNGATFEANVAAWIGSLPDVDAALRRAPSPRILDVGCGTGRSSVALARAYPRALVHGVDLDVASIDAAQRHAAAAGVADRVTFAVQDAATIAPDPRFHLAVVFEALHDTGDPVAVLGAVRSALEDGGAVYVADELVADRFGDEPTEFERLQFGFSVLHCVPATMAEDPVVASGTVLRAPTLDAWARAAGYLGARDLQVDDPFWRHYRLDPATS